MNPFRRAITPPTRRNASTNSQQMRSAVVGPSSSAAYSSYSGQLAAEWDAESAIRKNYLLNVVVYRCVQIRAQAVAKLPFRAGSDPDKPQEYDVNAPLARLLGPLGNPNPDFSAQMLFAHGLAQKLITGRMGWEVEWSGSQIGSGQVVALWPLLAQFLKPIPNGKRNQNGTPVMQRGLDGKVHYFTGFEYDADPANPRSLRSDQVFYHWNPSQHDVLQPESPLQSARLDVSVAIKQDIYDNAFLDNDARPAGILVAPAFADQGDYDAYEARLNAKYAGAHNAGKTMIHEIEDGEASSKVSWISLGLNQKDAQFIERHKQKAQSIAMALGVPFSKLDSSGRTFSNADAEDEAWEQETVINDAHDMAAAINNRLAPLVGNEKGWFDLTSLKSYRKRTNYSSTNPLEALEKGFISYDTYCGAIGEPAPGTEESKLVPYLERLKANPRQFIDVEVVEDTPALNAGPDNTQPELEEEIVDPEIVPQRATVQQRQEVSKDVQSSLQTNPHPAVVVDQEQRRSSIYRAADLQARTYERQWERSFRALFALQASAVASRLQDKRGRQAMKRAEESETPEEELLVAAFTYAYWQSQTQERAQQLMETVTVAVIALLLRRFNLEDMDEDELGVRAFVADRVRKLAEQITTTTQDHLRKTLAEGLSNNESTDELVARTNDVFDKAANTRAPLIGTNEVIGAMNQTTVLVADAIPKDNVGGKEWITRRDNKVRSAHRHVDGEAVPIGEKFRVAQSEMTGPHDPTAPADLVIGCRCILHLLTPEEYGNRSNSSSQYVRTQDIEAKLIAIAAGAA